MARKSSAGIQTDIIARKINASETLRLFLIFLLLDFILLTSAVFPSPGVNLWNAIWTYFSRIRLLMRAGTFTVFFRIEIFLLAFKLAFGSIPIRRKLKPIDEITKVAFQLGSQNTVLDEEKFQKLEDAINAISPTAENMQLRTGDRQFEGLESAVNALLERMRESYRQQTRFVSDASHELRTPIAVIKGYADMLERWGKTDEKVLTESIDAIQSESEHMNYLVEQLLFLARSDNGKTKMVIVSFDLSHLVQEVFEEYQMIDPDHTYECSAQNPVLIQGDLSLLKQAARILLDNAKKYTPAGGTIKISATRENDVPCFIVQDSGIGISPEALPHIFERFYRTDRSRARDTGGTGLGLSIAYWIINRHGGHFDVLSRENLGTRICVTLPQPDRQLQ